MEILRPQDNNIECTKKLDTLPELCVSSLRRGSVSFQLYRMFPEGRRLAENEVTTLLGILQSYPRQSVQILVFD